MACPSKSKIANAATLNFINANISTLDKDVCTQFGTKIQHAADYGQRLQDGFQDTM